MNMFLHNIGEIDRDTSISPADALAHEIIENLEAGLESFKEIINNYNYSEGLIGMEIHMYYYIFVNSSLPVTHANFSITKTFESSAYTEANMDASFKEKYLAGTVDYLPFIPNQGRDLLSFSPFCLNVMNDYRVEYDAELVRSRFFPLAPSRLSAVYAFADYETCQRVSEKHGWSLDSVHRFALILE